MGYLSLLRGYVKIYRGYVSYVGLGRRYLWAT